MATRSEAMKRRWAREKNTKTVTAGVASSLRQELAVKLIKYVERKKNSIPFLSEFAYENGYTDESLYSMPELKEGIKLLNTVKKTNLQKAGLANKVNVAMAIFILKCKMGFKENPPPELPDGKKQVYKVGGKVIEF